MSRKKKKKKRNREQAPVDRAPWLESFSEKRWPLVLFAIMVVGLTLRLLVVTRLPFDADEICYLIRSANIWKYYPLSTIDQGTLYLFITDVFYKVLGISTLAARMPSIIFGTCSILLVFLIGERIFGKTAGLASALLLAVSPYHVTRLAEMDETMAFAVLCSVYFLLRSEKSLWLYLLSAVFLGAAMLIKGTAMFYALAVGFCLLAKVYMDGKKQDKPEWSFYGRKIGKVAVYVFVVFVFFSPLVTHNVLLYADKGFLDDQFAGILGFGGEPYENMHKFSGFKAHEIPAAAFNSIIHHFLRFDPLVFILALAGFFIAWKKTRKNRYAYLLILLTLVVPFLFLSGTHDPNLFGKPESHVEHNIVFTPHLAIFAGAALAFLLSRPTFSNKQAPLTVVIVVLVVSVALVYPFMSRPNPLHQVREKIRALPEDAIFFPDTRIWDGYSTYVLMDRKYITLRDVFSRYGKSGPVLDSLGGGEPLEKEVYYLRCATPDWGHGAPRPEQVERARVMLEEELLKDAARVEKFQEDKRLRAELYRKKTLLDDSVIDEINVKHTHFFYPVMYRDESLAYDNYETHGPAGAAFKTAGRVIIFMLVAFMLVSPLLVFGVIVRNALGANPRSEN